jgi:hypothetical protein
VTPEQRKRRAREIQNQIHEILLRDWDPIGIADEPECQDEYQAYVGGLYRLLFGGASPEEVAQHLHQVADNYMGISYETPEQLLEVARKLCKLDVQL